MKLSAFIFLALSAVVVATTFDVAHRSTQEIGDFVPLSCNEEMSLCNPWSERFGTSSTYSKRIIIRCGECLTMDLHSLTLDGGLDIRGKLVVPDGHALEMNSTLVVVQGELEMNATNAVDGVPDIRFVLSGQVSQSFTPINENSDICGGDCFVGKKAIVVAGGKIASKYSY